MFIYAHIERILKNLSSEKIAFSIVENSNESNTWYLYTDLFWHRIATGVITKKAVFIGFKNSVTGEVVGNYIRLSSKSKYTKTRLKSILTFYATKIMQNNYSVLPAPIQENGNSFFKAVQLKKTRLDSSKNISGWSCGYLPASDFNFNTWSFETFDNMQSLEAEGITYADCFFDLEDENVVLIENAGGYNDTAVISSFDISDGWHEKDDNVMQSDLHSSYPIMFKYDDAIYGLPNIYANVDEIDFFQKTNDANWIKSGKVLDVKSKNVQDFTPFEHNGKWYAFGSNASCDVLSLYFAETPFSEWSEHPSSPIRMGTLGSRPAGNILYVNNKMYRLGQNCTNVYGGSVVVFEVVDLADDVYKENFVTEIKLPHPFVAFHTFNIGHEKILFDYRKWKVQK